MDFFGQVREGIARAVHLASDSHVFHEFPDCSILSTTNRLSIKLKDPQIYNALRVHWSPETTFDAITLLIRNEDNRKQTLMTAEIQAGNDVQTRAAILGVALLFAITEAYPQLRSMLDESMKLRRELTIK
uniref:Uncharacterized protein n=1 Tax=Panagrolaimus sp. ES5 TaxID=591445 RepID=A0AC34FI45_9BILA